LSAAAVGPVETTNHRPVEPVETTNHRVVEPVETTERGSNRPHAQARIAIRTTMATAMIAAMAVRPSTCHIVRRFRGA
jgi:hypothetical protein